ncbi:hypothetical protein ASZ90_006796 [hydrocarbon metagenome]|uniref:Uncharacterized protein n=1 Tax=hydrocarbon metagenome TaxID=938273 RepID=A0A0W8FRK1_9ZZZZ
MKKIIMLAIVLVMLLTSIGGCWPWWYEGDGYDRGESHQGTRDSAGPRGPAGGGPGGGGHGGGGFGGGH